MMSKSHRLRTNCRAAASLLQASRTYDWDVHQREEGTQQTLAFFCPRISNKSFQNACFEFLNLIQNQVQFVFGFKTSFRWPQRFLSTGQSIVGSLKASTLAP